MSVIVAGIEEPRDSSEVQVGLLEAGVRVYERACSWYKSVRLWCLRQGLGSASERAEAPVESVMKRNEGSEESFFTRYHRLGDSYLQQLALYETGGGVPPEPIETLFVRVKSDDLESILAPVVGDNGPIYFSTQGDLALYVDTSSEIRHVKRVLEARLLYYGGSAHIGHGKGRLLKIKVGKFDAYKCHALPSFEDYYHFPARDEKSESSRST